MRPAEIKTGSIKINPLFPLQGDLTLCSTFMMQITFQDVQVCSNFLYSCMISGGEDFVNRISHTRLLPPICISAKSDMQCKYAF